MTVQEIQKEIANLSFEELAEFDAWFQQHYRECLDGHTHGHEQEFPAHEEILLCLDVLWNTNFIRKYCERKALKDAGMSEFRTHFGILPPRPSMLEAKRCFENNYYSCVYEVIEQLYLLRGGGTLEELFKPNAMVVFLGSGKYGVEIFLTRDSEPLLVTGFSDPHQARNWIRESGDDYASQNGAPTDVTLLTIG